jgi:hypothetical protein
MDGFLNEVEKSSGRAPSTVIVRAGHQAIGLLTLRPA